MESCNSSAAWDNRTLSQVVVTSDDIMWLIGGENASSTPVMKGDVWNSSNGADWYLVNSTAFTGRRQHAAVAGDNDRIWVLGGYGAGAAYFNDVWYSDDKTNWLAPNTSAIPWTGRYSMALAYTPSDKRIWLFGGYEEITGAKNDVWHTQDGGNWTQAASATQMDARYFHSAVVTLNGTIFLMGGFPSSSSIWMSSPPVTMDAGVPNGVKPWGKAFTASQGGNFIGVECNDSTNLWNSTNVSFYVDSIQPVLTVSPPSNITYNATAAPTSVNVIISEAASVCYYSLNGAPNVTMDSFGLAAWNSEFTSAEGSNTIVISCNDTLNNWNSTSITFFLDSIKPVLNITKPFNITYTYTNLTVNVTTNESASICRYAHNTSGLNENWTLLNASAFTERQGHTIVKSANGTLWLIGGTYSAQVCEGEMCEIVAFYLNDTYYSTNGINWIQANASTAFAGRAYHTSVATSDGKLWVIGGYDGTNYYNDSWYSSDGVNWAMANNSIFAARSAHASTVDASGKIWVFGGLTPAAAGGWWGFGIMAGGGGTAPLNDTWYSTDGGNWTQANASTGIVSRSYAGMAATSDGKIWVFGGKNSADTALNDVWYSSDSINWIRATSSAEWPARYGFVSFSTLDNRLWVIGGTDGTNYYNDVWYSGNGTDWRNVNSTSNSSFWTPRTYFAGAVKGNNIYMAGGYDIGAYIRNDSWSTPIPPWYRDMDGSGTTWGKNFTAAHGNNDVSVRCWDTAGNLNSTMQWFSVDVQGPAITISSPLNQSYTTAPTSLAISTSETANTCVYSLNGAANVTMTGSGTSWSSTLTAINGGNTIIVSCQDLLGNWNSTSVAFYVSVSSGTTCGNNVCETGETCTSCSTDCGACTGGNSGSLSSGISSSNAAKDTSFSLIANLPFEKTIDKESIAVEKITLNSNEGAEKVNLQVSKYETLPKSIKAPEGNMYQALEIELDKKVDLKEAEICFNVEKQWMQTNEVQKEEVVLVRYNPRQVLRVERVIKQDGTIKAEVKADVELWQELVTTWVEKPVETNAEAYCAKTPGFSTYAIVARKQRAIEVIEEIAPIIESIQKPVPEKNEFVIPFSPPYKKLYTMLFIDLFLIFILTAAFSTGGNLYEEKKEIWYQCNEMVRKAPDSKKVKEFIRASLNRGYSESDIKQAIAGHGIDETCTELFIENVKQEIMNENTKGK